MKHRFPDIEMAYDFVSSESPLTNSAMLSRETGRIYYLSGYGDSDEDYPDAVDGEEAYIEIPHKHDLDLGSRLVRRFVRNHSPELVGDVADIFSRKGAYQRYKAFLRSHDLLESWHNYEDAETKAALKTWCRDNGIELTED